MKTRVYRPAWRSMGVWKWLSLAGVLFSLAIIVPYARLAGGSFHILGDRIEGILAGCVVHLGLVREDNSVRITAQMNPVCARRVDTPMVRLRGKDGTTLSEATLKGGPNGQRAVLALAQDIPDENGPLIFEMETLDWQGRPAVLTWPYPVTVS